jgi:hypothetical protein
MTVAQLQAVLEEIQDKNMEVVLTTDPSQGICKSAMRTLLTEIMYLGDKKYCIYGKNGGELERVVMIM